MQDAEVEMKLENLLDLPLYFRDVATAVPTQAQRFSVDFRGLVFKPGHRLEPLRELLQILVWDPIRRRFWFNWSGVESRHWYFYKALQVTLWYIMFENHWLGEGEYYKYILYQPPKTYHLLRWGQR